MKQRAIGIMQGRLSPSPDGRLQFFPRHWKQEFFRAAEIGFSGIEWLLDWPYYEQNPVLSVPGKGAIQQIVAQSGTPVQSICADYFMRYSFFNESVDQSVAMLIRCLEVAVITSHRLVVVPFLEQFPARLPGEKDRLRTVFTGVKNVLQKHNVTVALETEWTAEEMIDFLSSVGSDAVGVVYDVGNSTSYGFDCARDIQILKTRIKEVHLKERKKQQTATLPLGQGDVQWKQIFQSLEWYRGPYILQAWRGKRYRTDAARQLKFIQSMID